MSLFGKGRRDSDPEPAYPVSAGPGAGRPPRPAEGTPGPVHGGRSDPGTTRRSGGQNVANIGKSISIRGDLTGDEDLVVEGNVEGKIQLPNNELTIGANGNVRAEIHAKSVIIVGRVAGNVSAAERIEIQATGSVEGDVSAPRLVIQEGATLNGSIEMDKKMTLAKSVTAPALAASAAPAAPAAPPAPPR